MTCSLTKRLLGGTEDRLFILIGNNQMIHLLYTYLLNRINYKWWLQKTYKKVNHSNLRFLPPCRWRFNTCQGTHQSMCNLGRSIIFKESSETTGNNGVFRIMIWTTWNSLYVCTDFRNLLTRGFIPARVTVYGH